MLLQSQLSELKGSSESTDLAPTDVITIKKRYVFTAKIVPCLKPRRFFNCPTVHINYLDDFSLEELEEIWKYFKLGYSYKTKQEYADAIYKFAIEEPHIERLHEINNELQICFVFQTGSRRITRLFINGNLRYECIKNNTSICIIDGYYDDPSRYQIQEHYMFSSSSLNSLSSPASRLIFQVKIFGGGLYGLVYDPSLYFKYDAGSSGIKENYEWKTHTEFSNHLNDIFQVLQKVWNCQVDNLLLAIMDYILP